MAKQYAIQTRNKEHYTQWDDCYSFFDTESEGKKAFRQKVLDHKDYLYTKKTMRLVSFTVLDKTVPEKQRPAKGCAISEVLDFYEDK